MGREGEGREGENFNGKEGQEHVRNRKGQWWSRVEGKGRGRRRGG